MLFKILQKELLNVCIQSRMLMLYNKTLLIKYAVQDPIVKVIIKIY